jgi:hypothetical protein
MTDGEYRVVNIGHTERMENDPTFAFGNEVAEILLEMNDLEGALQEAEAQSDHGLAANIRAEMTALERQAIAFAEKQQRSWSPPVATITKAPSPHHTGNLRRPVRRRLSDWALNIGARLARRPTLVCGSLGGRNRFGVGRAEVSATVSATERGSIAINL